MASHTTLTRLTSELFTSLGACTSGSTERRWVATKRVSCGAATTSTNRTDLNRDRSADDARRRDDVDAVDADGGADVARRRGIFRCHVAGDDGGDDAAGPGPDAMALSPGRRQSKRDTSQLAHHARRRGLFLRLDRVRNGCLSAGCCGGRDRDA